MAFAISDTGDGITFSGGRSANVMTFRLLGGKYGWGETAASGSGTLAIVMPDGSGVNVATALTTSAAYTMVDLVPGTYTLTLVATGDVAGFVQKIPYNPSY